MNEDKPIANNNPAPSTPPTPPPVPETPPVAPAAAPIAAPAVTPEPVTPAVASTSAAPAPGITMQNVVQEMLPDDLKKKFVLQKNTKGGIPVGGDSQTPPSVASTLSQFEHDNPNLVQKPIRTYESDLAEALAKKQGSVASISIAESKKKIEQSRKDEMIQAAIARRASPQTAAIPKSGPESIPGMLDKTAAPVEEKTESVKPAAAAVTPPVVTPPLKPAPAVEVPPVVSGPRKSFIKPFFLTLFSLILLGAGGYEGYLLYQKTIASRPVPVEVKPIVIANIIPSDEQVSVNVGEKSGNDLLTALYAEARKNPLSSEKILELLVYNGTTRITGSSFMQKVTPNMPDVISRSLTDRWMFGTFGEETGQASSFIALTTDFFQNAFAGMLMWEDSMPDDLSILLNFKDRARKDELIGTSTISSYFTIQGTFSDKIIRNRDVREFRNKNGELLFLYSFVNKETLLITTTESSFIGLLDRIEKDTYVR